MVKSAQIVLYACVCIPGHLRNNVFPAFQKQQYWRAVVCKSDESKQVLLKNLLIKGGKPQHDVSDQTEMTGPEPANHERDSNLDRI